jgi:F420-0:gamma-glutamyl ligase-like protein
MTAKNVFVAGTDILASTMNANFDTLPWAMQVANGNITGTGTIALTAGRFHSTTPPLATATVVSTANTATSVTLGIATYSGTTWTFPVYVWSGTTASAVARSVTIVAIQQKSNASLG